MRINDPADFEARASSGHRTPHIESKWLLDVDEHHPFRLSIATFNSDEFHALRHRHNFEQIRIGLSGVTKYGRQHKMGEGVVGYFPEGTHYGPTTVAKAPTTQVVLQFQGASGNEIVSTAELAAATAQLRETGTFEDGYYRSRGPDGNWRNVDAFQASWERATGKKMVYPPQRFDAPIFMTLDAFPWLATEDPAVRRRRVATFSESEVTISGLEVVGATRLRSAPDRPLVHVLRAGSFAHGGRTYGPHSVVQLDPGDEADITAERAEFVVLALPTPAVA
jgi:hypothetical protein